MPGRAFLFLLRGEAARHICRVSVGGNARPGIFVFGRNLALILQPVKPTVVMPNRAFLFSDLPCLLRCTNMPLRGNAQSGIFVFGRICHALE